MDTADAMFHPSLAAALSKLDPEDGGKMMEYFQSHALLAREKSLLQASVREQKKLLVENGKLKRDIEQLKRELHDKQRRRVGTPFRRPLGKGHVPSVCPSLSAKALLSPSEPTEAASLGADGGPKGGGRPPADVWRLDLRVGRILAVRRHPLAADLAVQDVQLGEGAPRAVVGKWRADHVRPPARRLLLSSSLAGSFPRHRRRRQPVGSLAVFLCNVKAGKVKGVASQARLLRCFRADGPSEPLAPPPGSAPGDRVTFPDFPGEPERELRAKRRVWERAQPEMRVDAMGVANYRGCQLQVKGKGPCKAPSLTDAAIGCT
ncbi:aminoacyl tRNA synthase complex-interacting multifunctional protein 1-like isoform X1 [Stigmatopora argus]